MGRSEPSGSSRDRNSSLISTCNDLTGGWAAVVLATAAVVLATAAGGVYWAVTRSAEPCSRAGQFGRRPEDAAATRPAETAERGERGEKHANPALPAACREAGEAIRARLDESFAVMVSPPFVVAGDMPISRLEAYARGTVIRPAELMWANYFEKKPDKVITVLLFVGDESYRSWAKRLFGDTDVSHFGYYKHANRTLVMNISTGGGTLVHELTHALIVYDFPGVPLWFNEGLASLHEQCDTRGTEIVGLVNWRLPGLVKGIRAGTLRPLRELLTRRDFYGRQLVMNYAQARYFVMYMQNRGVLKEFYVRFRDDHTGPDADVKNVERVFAKDIEAIEKDFIAWVKTLRFE